MEQSADGGLPVTGDVEVNLTGINASNGTSNENVEHVFEDS